MAELFRGTVTLVFSDIEGSTRLLETLGETYGEVLGDHRALLRDAFTSHGGVEVDTQGDALFYAFSRARDAVAAAVVAQQALDSHPWPADTEVRVRMGLHTGEPQTSSEGYVGADVHLAARICSAAHGGQVLISNSTKDLVDDTRLEGATLRDLGEHVLKDISSRVHLYQLVIHGLRSDFPPLRTRDARPTNLPRIPRALIGRAEKVAELSRALREGESRMITLTGPGGIGKTRLAIEVGHHLSESFADGVFLVDLSVLTDPSLVVAHIAASLGLKESGGRSLKEAVHDYLGSRKILLVIDNFEQVMDGAPDIAELLSAAPEVGMLITSREPLRIAGEQEFSVPPLSLPPTTSAGLEETKRSPAVALFSARARKIRGDFAVTDDNAADVAGICRRVDGLPLAIELAAARVKVLSPHALLDRLDHSLKVLSSGRRDASERQRTLRGTISWSYDLLSEDEQKLFRRLGVFAGGWTLEAADQVCDREDFDLDVLDGLASLVDKSLVRAVERGERFAMLETIREFALEKLEESGEAEGVRRAHAEFFRALAEEAEPHFFGEGQNEWLERLEGDVANLLAALDKLSADEPDRLLRMTVSLRHFWRLHGHLTEARRRLEEALTRAGGDGESRAQAWSALALTAYYQGDYVEAQRYEEKSLSLSTELSLADRIASGLSNLGMITAAQGDASSARLLYEESLKKGRELNDPVLIAQPTHNLSDLAFEEGEFRRARALATEALALWRSVDDPEGVTLALVNLGLAAIKLGEIREAGRSLREGLLAGKELGSPVAIAACLDGLGAVAIREGKASEAALLLGAVDVLRQSVGAVAEPFEYKVHEETASAAMETLGPQRFAEARTRGHSMTTDEAIDYALALVSPNYPSYS